MSWREFSYLLAGLSGDTPLGRLISIRAETDPEKIKGFSTQQRLIRNEYLAKQAKHKTKKQTDDALNDIKNALVRLAE